MVNEFFRGLGRGLPGAEQNRNGQALGTQNSGGCPDAAIFALGQDNW